MLLEDLPAEIIEAILSHLPPKSLINTSKTSKKLHQIADTPLLWRSHCRTQFRFWDPSHGLPANFTSPVNDINWKDKFRNRMNLERRVDQTMDTLINTQTDKLPTMQRMLAMSDDFSEYTYDVKEALLRHCAAPEEKEDYLARRYWAKAVLEKLHRGFAIEEWKRCMLRGGTSSEQLERNIAAFDLFVSDDEQDINSVITSLDIIAAHLQTEHPELDTLSTREKATTIATFLRAHGHNGASDEEYHNLPNNFLGIALRDSEHHSLPLIAVSIFCFVARRLGLSAHPCSFPMHVYAIVSSPSDRDLDGRSSSKAPENMYIDAFRDPIEVPQHHLQAQLRSMGASAYPEEFLSKAKDTEIIIRSSRNMMHSVQTLQMHGNIPLPNPNDLRTPLWYRQKPDFDKAFYASLWSTMLMQTHHSTGMSRRRHYLPFLLEYVQQHCPWDADLVEKHITPMFNRYPEEFETIRILGLLREKDWAQPKVRTRSDELDGRAGNVQFKVGQVFRHRRYGYEGVVVGWDKICGASDAWIESMGVDRLSGGRAQSFYHVLVNEKSTRYVAQENIRPVEDEPSEALKQLAGRYFRRWDREVKRFVSNIKDEYPDD
ncbi:YccV-like-domain-containing protein [Venturia nashicola]|uniref:YccV-like-domain-containing protein n=1 Tax=Venturia nashicola TaxID=86259 RepID=A0A4Z1NIP3_9PEZI|nr:YccV-like-domain-containing protein [Venturia nashicola]TLD20193.1 YccV-like-domain-containing protein [Venturia nashicola]